MRLSSHSRQGEPGLSGPPASPRRPPPPPLHWPCNLNTAAVLSRRRAETAETAGRDSEKPGTESLAVTVPHRRAGHWQSR
jgi:hypothetical protein